MKLSYSATKDKMIKGQYGAFELGVIHPGKRESVRIKKYTDDSPEGALTALHEEVSRYGENTLFEISAKKNSKDTTSTADVWQFNNLELLQPAAVQTWPANGPGFGGLGGVPQGSSFGGFGLIDPADLKAENRRLIDLDRELNKRELQLTLGEYELKTRSERHKEQIAADRELLKDLEKKYNSTSGAAKHGFETLLGEVLGVLARDGHLGSMATRFMGLPAGGALGGDETPAEESTPEREVIEAIAADIDAQGLDLATLQRLRGRIAQTLANMKKGGGE